MVAAVAEMAGPPLAHDYDMVQPFAGAISDVGSLDELARSLWDLDAPDLGPGDAGSS